MNKKIWFIGTPEHANMGDHLITEAQFMFMKECFPFCDVREVSLDDYYAAKSFLKKMIDPDDLLFFNGGGSVGNIWPRGEEMRRDAFSTWSENTKIVFPQSVYFADKDGKDDEIEKTKNALSQNVFLGCRDRQSFDFAAANFGCEYSLSPDIALFPEYPEFHFDREGALLCLRTDREAQLSEESRNEIGQLIEQKYSVIKKYDMVREAGISMEKRHSAVMGALKQFASSKVVVTDRLHGMIFSYVTGTPCFVFENSYFKVRGQFEWIKDCGFIHIVKDLEELKNGLERFIAAGEAPGQYKRLDDKFDDFVGAVTKYIKKENEDYSWKTSNNALVCIKENSITSEPLVSVIIPVYNVEKYLEKCVKSIMSQTLKDIEIICIDDGSSDESLRILEELVSGDGRVSVFHQENSGLSATRNRGVEASRGKYIYFMDSDDILEADALETLSGKMESESLEMVFFDGKSFFSSDVSEEEKNSEALQSFISLYSRKHDYDGVYDGLSFMSELLLNDEYRPSACLQMARKDFIDKNMLAFEEGILHEDNLYTFEALLKAERVGYVHREFFHRRVRGESIMFRKKTFANVFGYYICYKKMIEAIKKEAIEEAEPESIKKLQLKDYYAADELINMALENARRIYNGLPKDQQRCYRLYDDRELIKSLIVDYCEEKQKQVLLKKEIDDARKKELFNTARIDIKNKGKDRECENEIEFSKLSGEAEAARQTWGAEYGATYVVLSQDGMLDIKLKCVKDGDLSLRFRTVQDFSGDGEEIAWWINYKKISVNEKNVIEGPECVWYRTPIEFELKDVKDGEIFDIHVEWECGETVINALKEEKIRLQKEIRALKKEAEQAHKKRFLWKR